VEIGNKSGDELIGGDWEIWRLERKKRLRRKVVGIGEKWRQGRKVEIEEKSLR
jgi:hypothetical protein